jgi:hypothetical protein
MNASEGSWSASGSRKSLEARIDHLDFVKNECIVVSS